MLAREVTSKIKIGSSSIGGSCLVKVQSMCSVPTKESERIIDQINECARLGADFMRVSILDEIDAIALEEITKKVSIPIIADIHFDYRLAISSLEHGASAIRINPGNIGSIDKVEAIVEDAKKHHAPIRIGINAGSLEKEFLNEGDIKAKDLVSSAVKYVDILHSFDFKDIVLSLKSSSVLTTIEAYRLASKRFPDIPLHIGLTEAGPSETGLIRSTAALAPLLLEGIGDTIRISLSEDPVEEIKACMRLLHDLGLKYDYPTFISCPSCGRTKVGLLPLAKKVRDYLESNHINKKVAVMGCVVNGPGEAKEADIGLAGGDGIWVLFKKGKPIRNIKDEDAYNELIEEIKKL